jgi:hypothetical protein
MDRPNCRTCLAIDFWFFNFDLEFITDIQSFKELIAKIYLITIGLRGRVVIIFLEL